MRTFLTNALAAGPNIRRGMEQEQERQRSRIQTQQAQLGLDESQFRFDELQQMQPYRYRQAAAGAESAELGLETARFDRDLQQRFGVRDRELQQQQIEGSIAQNELALEQIRQQMEFASQENPLRIKMLQENYNNLVTQRQELVARREALANLTNRIVTQDPFRGMQGGYSPDVPQTRDTTADPQPQQESEVERIIREENERRNQRHPGLGLAPTEQTTEQVAGLQLRPDMPRSEFLAAIGADDPRTYMAGGMPAEEAERVSMAELRRQGRLIDYLARLPSEPLQRSDDESPQDFRKRENRYNNLVQETSNQIKRQLNRLNPDRMSDNQIQDMGFQSREQLKQIVSLFSSDDFRDFLAERPRLLMELDRNYEVAPSFGWYTTPVRTGEVPIGDLLQIAGAMPDGLIDQEKEVTIPPVDRERRDRARDQSLAEAEARRKFAEELRAALREENPNITQEAIDRAFRGGSPSGNTITESLLDEDNTFQANPEYITPEMVNLQNTREVIVEQIQFLSQHGGVESTNQIFELTSQIRQIDATMFQLMARQATLEFSQFNDPRRMDRARSVLDGVTVQTVPRSDGLWDEYVNGQLRMKGVSSEDIVRDFTMRHDAEAQAAYRQMQQDIFTSNLKIEEQRQIDQNREAAKVQAEIHRILTIGEFERYLDNLHNSPKVRVIPIPEATQGEPNANVIFANDDGSVSIMGIVQPYVDQNGVQVPGHAVSFQDRIEASQIGVE